MKPKDKELKDITTAKIYANDKVLKNAPRHTHIRELQFFTLGKYVSDDELAKEYASRGLEPADLYSIARWDEAHKDRQDKKDIGTHWKDADGTWCFAAFRRWDGGRLVGVGRSDRDWIDRWSFVGVPVRKSSDPESSALKPLELRVAELESKVERITDWIKHMAPPEL